MKKLLLLIAFLSIPAAFAKGGSSEVENGGGLAEKNLAFAYQELHQFIRLCLETPLCGLTKAETGLLVNIQGSLHPEQANYAPAASLVFKSGKENPGFFMIDGLIRVAKTSDQPGDPIYINSDLLYTRIDTGDGTAEFRAMDVPLAVSVLVHELGHHQGVKDHALLDVLGTKLQVLLLKDSEKSYFWNGNAAVSTFQLNHVHSDQAKQDLRFTDEVVLENGSQLYPLTTGIAQAMRCPKLIRSHKMTGLRLYNLHGERGLRFDRKTQLITKPFRAWYVQSCESGKESGHGDLLLSLTFKKKFDGSFDFLPEKTRIAQLSCAEHPEVCK